MGELVGAGGIKAACPAVDQGKNPASGCLAVSGVSWPEAEDPQDSLNDPFWVGPCTLCGFYFWLCE